MSTLRQELRWHRRTLQGWLVAILILMLALLSFFPTFEREADNFAAMIRAFPQEILQGFGLDISTISSFGGYLAYIYTFVQLVLALLAMVSGLNLMGREKLNKASDFLLVKPVSRTSLWLQKVAVGLLGILVINALITMVCIFIARFLNQAFTNDVFAILWGSSLIQLIFFFLGAMLAALRKKLKSVVGQASSITFGFYFILIIARLLEDEKLYRLSIFGLFDASEVQRAGFDPIHVVIALSLISLLAGVGYWSYTRQDVEV